jgi:hypothetical protein
MHYPDLRRAPSVALAVTKGFAIATLALSLMTPAAWAQSETGGSISVTATDPSGAGVPGAKLALKDTSTNIIHKGQTQQNGTYTFPNLAYGNYELTVGYPGGNRTIHIHQRQAQGGRHSTDSDHV